MSKTTTITFLATERPSDTGVTSIVTAEATAFFAAHKGEDIEIILRAVPKQTKAMRWVRRRNDTGHAYLVDADGVERAEVECLSTWWRYYPRDERGHQLISDGVYQHGDVAGTDEAAKRKAKRLAVKAVRAYDESRPGKALRWVRLPDGDSALLEPGRHGRLEARAIVYSMGVWFAFATAKAYTPFTRGDEQTRAAGMRAARKAVEAHDRKAKWRWTRCKSELLRGWSHLRQVGASGNIRGRVLPSNGGFMGYMFPDSSASGALKAFHACATRAEAKRKVLAAAEAYDAARQSPAASR